MFRRIPILALVILTGLPVLAGCSAIFGQRYDNFTAYYNTFFNERMRCNSAAYSTSCVGR